MESFLTFLLKKLKSYWSVFVVLFLFLILPLLIPIDWNNVTEMLLKVPIYESAILYIAFLVASTVLAPLSTLALMPFATGLFGWVSAAILSIIGWSIGAILAYLLARYLGNTLKFNFLQKIKAGAEKLPRTSTFWGLVLLRMLIPVDVLSYAVGFFTQMEILPYTLATIIGITPFAFIFSYAANAALDQKYLPLFFSILTGLVFFIFVGLGYKIYKNYK